MNETERVRAIYRERDSRPSGRYDESRPDVVARLAARNRIWGNALRGNVPGIVVEVGAGSGEPARWVRAAGAALVVAVDVDAARLRSARERDPMVLPVVANGLALPFGDGVADVVICSTLFSSILDDGIAAQVAREIRRLLRPGGRVLWFDFFRDNPRNADVRGIRPAQLAAWFAGDRVELERVVLAPPVARALGRFPRLSAALELLPPLRTHLAGTITRA